MAKAYDVIIVGAGAAGLSASIYTSRRALSTLIISQDIGGQAATTTEVENYPGVGFVGGFDLMQKFLGQAKEFGTEMLMGEVTKVEKNADETFTVHTTSESFQSRAVILAFGLSHRHLDVPGEHEFIGKGVSYCATCDAPLYKEKHVVVVGGGSSALDAALLLVKHNNTVTLVHRTAEFTGEPILVERVAQEPKITVKLSSAVQEIKGSNRVESVVVGPVDGEPGKGETLETLAADGVFVEIGFRVKPDIIKGLVELDQRNQIVISRDNETSVPGIFAAGDVTTISYKQIVISAGEGAKAALQTYKYLLTKRGARPLRTDWGVAPKPSSN
jgi:thioredoxin reductase (NADPH)